MADTSLVLHKPQNKSSARNIAQVGIDLIEWKNYYDNICPQCGQDHSYKITGGITILDMISFLDRDSTSKR